jgi:hypothetical protein
MQLGATTPDHVFNNADFGEVRVDIFLVLCVVFHCFLFSPFAFVHWIVGPSLIYGKGPWWLNSEILHTKLKKYQHEPHQSLRC